MIELKETTTVDRKIDECFRYVADFRTSAEWDVTAYKATKTSSGPIGLGTVFDVRCKLPVGFIDLRYEIVEFEPPHRIALSATGWLFDAVDTIEFTETDGGTRIDYSADFTLKAPFSALESRLESGMYRMGKSAVRSLGRALGDQFKLPETASSTRAADKLVWPGVAMFSKWGYNRGRKRWRPISADLTHKRVVVTGASSGLGLATAGALADRGAELILVMRNEQRASEVVENLISESGNDRIRYELADLSLMSDVDDLVQRLLRRGQPIDVLVNNAGALFNDWTDTSENLEQSFALLLLSPWRLTRGLHPLLKQAAQTAGVSRVVNVVSGGMYTQKLDIEQLQASPDGYNGAVAYARCKRALTIVTEEWAEDWAGDGIVVNAMHPGWADTPGVESALPGFHTVTKRILRTPDEGADTIVWLAAATEAARVTGKLFLDREARSPHLLSRTQERSGDRERLMRFMEEFNFEKREAA
ncbi:MAG: SDR family NAD(P)-dependent oxidoreductase [Pseudomonadota bacterium]